MDYNLSDFEVISSDDKIANINRALDVINNSTILYKKKYTEISEKITVLTQKTNLKFDNTVNLLKFQNQLILNEIRHLKSYKQVISDKLNSELYSLSEKLVFICISISNLSKDINSDNVKQVKKISSKNDLNDILASINDSFRTIKELLIELKNYSDKMSDELRQSNFHCRTLAIDMTTRRYHIFMEYKRQVEYYVAILSYFNDLAEAINENFDNSSIIGFLVSETDMEPGDLMV